jgi:glycosyltransferase involved in cell wall biosynthesis
MLPRYADMRHNLYNARKFGRAGCGSVCPSNMIMRVAHSVSSIEHMGSGITYCVRGLAEAQTRNGAAPQVFSLGSKVADGASSFLDHRFVNDLSGVPALDRLGKSDTMRRALHEMEPDILHTHGLWMLPNVYRTADAPFVISTHGMLSSYALSISPLKKQVFRLLFQNGALHAAALFHATAESEYDDIRRFGLRQPVAVIPNGIELPVFRPVQRSNKTVLSLGRIHPQKRLQILIRAWSMIEPAFPDWRLLIVGPDHMGYANELKVLVRELNLNNVSIDGPVFGDEKAAFMASADIFVLPSQSENFAMTVAESLATGVPVISTKGAPWAGLEAHRCGWWIDHGPHAMATALHAAISLPEGDRRSMGQRGRDWMARDFSWDSVAAKMCDVYAWLLRRQERPEWVQIE